MIDTNRHRAVKLSSSPSSTTEGTSTRTGQRRLAALAAALAATVLLLGGTPAAAQPTPKDVGVIDIDPGEHKFRRASGAYGLGLFDNAGTNPRITKAEFSTKEYYHPGDSGIYGNSVNVVVKTTAQLNALPVPPDSPFDVTVDVEMTNDEGETAEIKLTFRTAYDRDSTTVTPAPAQPTGPAPTFKSQEPVPNTPVGVAVHVNAEGYFDNAGTNPRFTKAKFSNPEYLDSTITGVHEESGLIAVKVKTAAELNAMASPPSNPFSYTLDATMENDEGHTATGKLSFTDIYWPKAVESTPPPPPTPPEPIEPAPTINAEADKTFTIAISDVFTNAGTNPRITGGAWSTTQYFVDESIRVDPNTGAFSAKVKPVGILDALPNPPPDGVTVTFFPRMLNDEGLSATGEVKIVIKINRPT